MLELGVNDTKLVFENASYRDHSGVSNNSEPEYIIGFFAVC